MHNTLANRGLINYGPLTELQLVEIKKQVCLMFNCSCFLYQSLQLSDTQK